jgi:hypothetical protein
MSNVADETAYYFNRKVLAVALITEGVRFPRGIWSLVAGSNWTQPQVEQALTNVFPNIKGQVLTFVTLATEEDVKTFEASLRSP